VVIFLLLLAFASQPASAKRDADDLGVGHGQPHLMPPGLLKKVEPAALPQPVAPAAPAPAPAMVPPPAEPPVRPVPASQNPAPAAPAPMSAPEPAPAAAQPESDRGAPAPVVGVDPPAAEPVPAVPDPPKAQPKVAVPVNGLVAGAGSGLALSAALGATAVGVGVRAIQHHRAQPAGARNAPATPGPRPGLADLLLRAERNPFDGEARFRLGLELFERGREKEALRYLAQAFRYHPQAILEILREPRLAHVRNHEGVRIILKRFQREASRRLWTGYS
jgi:hypothetical protein